MFWLLKLSTVYEELDLLKLICGKTLVNNIVVKTIASWPTSQACVFVTAPAALIITADGSTADEVMPAEAVDVVVVSLGAPPGSGRLP